MELCCVCRDSSFCRATHHGLDGPGVVSRCGGEIFRTRAERSWSLPSHLYNGYWVSYPGVKRPGRDVYHPPLSGAEVNPLNTELNPICWHYQELTIFSTLAG